MKLYELYRKTTRRLLYSLLFLLMTDYVHTYVVTNDEQHGTTYITYAPSLFFVSKIHPFIHRTFPHP